jgi:hypothetical protein
VKKNQDICYMHIFKNFIVVMILTGIFTRIINFYLRKKIKRLTAAYVTFLISLVFIAPLASAFVGFDVAVAIYVFSLLAWLLFDLLRNDAVEEK